MIARSIVFLLLISLLISCAETTVKSTVLFDLIGRDYLYDKNDWSLHGRLALSDKSNSLSASISWRHQRDRDEIELSGPFGQRHTVLLLTEDKMVTDDGDKQVQYHGNIDNLVSIHTGIAVPVSALKYWVLGLVKPNSEYVITENGFLQSGWKVKYSQMQFAGEDELPRKIKIEKEFAKLKLIINRWD